MKILEKTKKTARSLLFLQGPLGPFFSKLAERFIHSGYSCHRVTLNGGDHYYAHSHQHARHQDACRVAPYTGTPEQWPAFLSAYLQKHAIETVFVMGDCRYYHRRAKAVCNRLGVRFLVFEEGYLRPDTITMEEQGANALTRLDLSRTRLRRIQPHLCKARVAIGNSMPARTRFASVYYWAAFRARKRFGHYQHHRAFHPVIEGCQWLRGLWRKALYTTRDACIQRQLTGKHSQHFFLVPLQVHDDSQIVHHSSYDSVTQFIKEIVLSFARCAPHDSCLVIKHHPMDRGYTPLWCAYPATGGGTDH